MLFSNIPNIYAYNNPYLIHRRIETEKYYGIGPLNFLEKIDNDAKIIFSELKYNILKEKFPNSNIYLVTNKFEYYLKNRSLNYVRYLPLFSNLVYSKKIYKTVLNTINIELSGQVFLQLFDISKLNPDRFREIKKDFGDIYVRLSYFQKATRDFIMNYPNPVDMKYDLDPNVSYKNELMLTSPDNDFICYALPFHNDLAESNFCWFKDDSIIHNLVLQTLDYFDLDKSYIDDSADTYYMYTVHNDDNFVSKVHKNIRECFSVLKDIENDHFKSINSFSEVLDYLKS